MFKSFLFIIHKPLPVSLHALKLIIPVLGHLLFLYARRNILSKNRTYGITSILIGGIDLSLFKSFLDKPIVKRISKILIAITGISYLVVFFLLLFLIIATSFDRRLLINSEYVTVVAFYAIILSAPGALVSFFDDILIPEKKVFIGTLTCPDCNKVFDIELKEK